MCFGKNVFLCIVKGVLIIITEYGLLITLIQIDL